MLTTIATWWDRIPATIRDFLESLISAGILGAGAALLAVNLGDPTLTPKIIVAIILKAFIDSVIAAARHRLATPK